VCRGNAIGLYRDICKVTPTGACTEGCVGAFLYANRGKRI